MDKEPIADKFMRYSPKLRAHIDKEVNSLLEKGLIYPSDSPYASKVILAPKGDSWRMCIDYRKINQKTRSDRYPLPNIEEIYA